MERFRKGYKEPINQFLLFVEVYSLGGATTPFYRLDAQENIQRFQAEMVRDALGRIIELKVDQRTFSFTLDGNGNVTDLKVS